MKFPLSTGTSLRGNPIPLQSASTLKLFITGSTVGPIVDSLHNQCLLEYDRAPINIPMNTLFESVPNDIDGTISSSSYLFCSSWFIPLLLGIAYVVLGDILPNLIDRILQQFSFSNSANYEINTKFDGRRSDESKSQKKDTEIYRNRAILAVTTTAMIIKLSEFLQTHPDFTLPILASTVFSNGSSNISNDSVSLFIMMIAAAFQWFLLDGTLTSFATAFIVGIGGPLSELPFVATNFWHYIPSAANYYPLANIDFAFLKQFSDLALSSITGPCYFAVTMDAIALGRWFSCNAEDDDVDLKKGNSNQ
mmetsp:Transcript_23555/g.27253  ORF Transcript_23555/g.27253 Transcript_23555/m.27253 type:complete len:307 (+) Transcript_23555:230-1150(+)